MGYPDLVHPLECTLVCYYEKVGMNYLLVGERIAVGLGIQRALGNDKGKVMHGNSQRALSRIEVSLNSDVTMWPHVPYQD